MTTLDRTKGSDVASRLEVEPQEAERRPWTKPCLTTMDVDETMGNAGFGADGVSTCIS